MVNPFFKNTGPFKVFEILDLLNLDTRQASSNIIINDIKKTELFLVVRAYSMCSRIGTGSLR